MTDRLILLTLLSPSLSPVSSRTVGPKECCVWLAWNTPGTRQLWFNWCTSLLPPCPISHQLLHYRKNYTREMKMEIQSENREEHKLSNHMWLMVCNISAFLEGQIKAGREDSFLQKIVVTIFPAKDSSYFDKQNSGEEMHLFERLC